jgi:hypothetical protein
VGLSLLFCLVGVSPARAFVSYINDAGQAEKWNLINPPTLVSTNCYNRATHSIRYYLGLDAFAEPKRTAVFNAARACFDQWQAVPNSILRFEYSGLMSGNYQVAGSGLPMPPCSSTASWIASAAPPALPSHPSWPIPR